MQLCCDHNCCSLGVKFLSTRVGDGEPDAYFEATRTLAYQLLHQPETRSVQATPLLVLCPPHVSMQKRSILAAEGAIIVPVQDLNSSTGWIKATKARWVDQFTKLRVISLDQFERIAYMDADMLVTAPLNGIFALDATTQVQQTSGNSSTIHSAPAC